MKAFLAITAMAFLVVETSYGQGRAVLQGSLEDAEARRNAWIDPQLIAAKREKGIDSGRCLFGVDERWTAVFDSKGKSEFAGTLFIKQLPDFRVGDWGCSDDFYTVLQRLGDNALLASTRAPVNDVVLLRGLDCSKVTDGVEFILQRPVFITGTHTYTALAGDSKTVLLIECDTDRVSKLMAAEVEKKRTEARAREEALVESMRLEKARQEQQRAEEEARQKQAMQKEAVRQKRIEDAKRRTWIFSDGSRQVDAKFVRLANGVVTLQSDDGKEFDIRWDRLSLEDQSFVRQRRWMPVVTFFKPTAYSRISFGTGICDRTSSHNCSVSSVAVCMAIIMLGEVPTKDSICLNCFRLNKPSPRIKLKRFSRSHRLPTSASNGRPSANVLPSRRASNSAVASTLSAP